MAAELPHAPHGLPLVGHAVWLLRDPLGALAALRPLGDVVGARVGRRRVAVLTSPAVIREVLVTGAHDFGKGAAFDALKPVVGKGSRPPTVRSTCATSAC